MQYGQFCPIAKATEILGERWTILVVRELLMGARRFNELQRGLGDISPTLLTSRLRDLEAHGLVAKRPIPGQRGKEYHATPACKALLPAIVALGEWGMVWARDQVLDADLDIELLMLYLERSVDPDQMVGDSHILRFHFDDLVDQQDYWLLIREGKVDMCLTDPGQDVDVYFYSTLRALHDVWMGDRSWREAIAAEDLRLEGDPQLTRRISKWLRPSVFAEAPRAERTDLPEVRPTLQ
ncbi:winged helix-turn-helix transcriptional regulator [Sphingomicrobium aestuariivivum]|uniref:winged helix-turn-helix transcriptional regulator n=1 Tax=Sphingomicrobium aestuariivivum TaxID=1582356 RepID=UPI001FD7151C|nr:helix-turn-helix domain-containing protein [Sphingomicrobium aestuariivivum]MCJ8190605.1 helix-turn-helix transcriptional regulator [Sphingomicrobium aestuariivivum]